MNILFICVDQFRFDCLSSLGHPCVQTPNLDTLAAHGIQFTSAFASTAPCGPSRASMFTGTYPDTNGVINGNNPLKPADRPILTQHLQAAGMHTALIGKLHLNPICRDFGFDTFKRSDYFFDNYDPEALKDSRYVHWLQEKLGEEAARQLVEQFSADEASYANDQWRFIVGGNRVDEEHHHTTWITDEAIRFLDNADDKPFFLNVSYFGPHQPYACPAPWDTMYNPNDIPLPDDFDNGMDDKPIIANNGFYQPLLKQREEQGWTRETHRQALAAYYGNISMLDHHIGRLLKALQISGHADDTMIVFTADHGDMAGQFGCYFKSLGYDGSARVPLIIRDPRSSRVGQCESRAVSLIDLFSTFLAVPGAISTEQHASRDLTPLIMDQNTHWDDRIFFKQGSHAMLVQGPWKLLRDQVKGQIVYEFYDRTNLPIDSNNLWNNETHSYIQTQMMHELNAWFDSQSVELISEQRNA